MPGPWEWARVGYVPGWRWQQQPQAGRSPEQLRWQGRRRPIAYGAVLHEVQTLLLLPGGWLLTESLLTN